jgi:hypothetical protein
MHGPILRPRRWFFMCLTCGCKRVYSEERAEEIREFLAGDTNNIIPSSTPI